MEWGKTHHRLKLPLSPAHTYPGVAAEGVRPKQTSMYVHQNAHALVHSIVVQEFRLTKSAASTVLSEIRKNTFARQYRPRPSGQKANADR